MRCKRGHWFLVGALLALPGAVLACGGSSTQPFTYTPLPYTVIAGPDGTPEVISDLEEDPVSADLLTVRVQSDRVETFTRRMREQGFEVIRVLGADREVPVIHLKVPPGAYRDAARFIERVDGVQSVSYAYYRSG
jgi:hypothetical protein